MNGKIGKEGRAMFSNCSWKCSSFTEKQMQLMPTISGWQPGPSQTLHRNCSKKKILAEIAA